MTPEDLDSIADLLLLVQDKEWRMRHLYLILDAEGNVVPMKFNADQETYWTHRHNRNVIVKGRKVGMSTLIVINNGDDCVWIPNFTAGIIDLKEDDVIVKLDMFRFAWENGPTFDWPDPRMNLLWKAIHEANPLVTDSDNEMAWAKGGSMTAGTGFTGRTPQALHWSEAGPMSAQRPAQARKIFTGSINSPAPAGRIDIESTMEGARVGVFYKLTEAARENLHLGTLSPVQWKIHFFPWQNHPLYILPGAKPVKASTRGYFKKVKDDLNIHIPDDRQAWWEQVVGDSLLQRQQFPTYLEEAFSYAGERPRFEIPAIGWLDAMVKKYAQTVKFGELQQQRPGEEPLWIARDESEAWMRLWMKPQEGYRYILALDSCRPEYLDDDNTLDHHGVLVVRCAATEESTGRHVPAAVVAAIIPDVRWEWQTLAERVKLMSDYYGGCMVIPEVTGMTGLVNELRRAGVSNIWHRTTKLDNPATGTGRTVRIAGWDTTKNTKPLLIAHLATVIKEHGIQLWCPHILHELRMFQQHNEALMGHHDDWVMTLAMALYASESATVYQRVKHTTPRVLQGLTAQEMGSRARPGEQI